MEPAERFARLIATLGCEQLVPNIKAEVFAARLGALQVPVSVAPGGGGGHYFVSPEAAFVSYTQERMRLGGAGSARGWTRLAAWLLGAVRPMFWAAGLDRQVQINNWLFSTCPLPPTSPAALAALRNELAKAFPKHAVVLRTLNDHDNGAILAGLKAQGWLLWPARRIYLQEAESAQKSRNHMLDGKLLAKQGLQVVWGAEWSDADFVRAEAQYRALYLEKYSRLNPAYTARFLQEMCRAGFLEVFALKNRDGALLAWASLFQNGGVVCSPAGGYDTSLPKAMGLYRLISFVVSDYALRQGLRYNMSSGAGDFKRTRGGVPTLEYLALSVAHLPWYRRVACRAIGLLLRRAGGVGARDTAP